MHVIPASINTPTAVNIRGFNAVATASVLTALGHAGFDYLNIKKMRVYHHAVVHSVNRIGTVI